MGVDEGPGQDHQELIAQTEMWEYLCLFQRVCVFQINRIISSSPSRKGLGGLSCQSQGYDPAVTPRG